MRRIETILNVAVASLCISGCALDATRSGDQVQAAAADPVSGHHETCAVFRVGLAANSAEGSCLVNDTTGSRCNLRGALSAAAQQTSPVTIELAVDSVVESDQIEVLLPPNGLGRHLIVRGAANEPAKAIVGFGASRFLTVDAGVTVDLENVDISGFAANDEGGTILNYGTMNLRKVTISQSQVMCEANGATQAVVSCRGGAIANHGVMTLGDGTRIESSKVNVTAINGAFVSATALGGGVFSDGDLTVEGQTVFALNFVVADATAGSHGMPGGAEAYAYGGAIYNAGGTLVIKGSNRSCSFFANYTWSWAVAEEWARPMNISRGGAIASVGGTFVLEPNACVFKANGADVDYDVYSAP